MAFSARYPIWLPGAPGPTAAAFTLLFAIESLARASVATVIALQAYDILQSSQKVSQVYTLVAIGSLIGTLLIPLLIQFTARRFIYSFGGLGLVLGALAMASYTLEGQVIGMFLRVFGAACLNVTTSLYILNHIRKTDDVKVEPMRMTFATFSWTIGPSLGVWLYTTYGVWAPHVFTAVCAAVLLCVFWYLRLSDSTAIRAGSSKAGNPYRNIRRFIAQPRLRLAWMIAFGRSCFWVTFFVYAPILVVQSGLGKQAGGFLVSAGNAMLITAYLFGKYAQRTGVRRVIALAFAVMSMFAFGAGSAGPDPPYVTATLLLGAALAAVAIDGVGSIPFMRAVHTHERASMTSVYRTYLDLSELLPTALFSVVLLFAPLSAVFVILGVWAAVCGLVAWRYLPKRL